MKLDMDYLFLLGRREESVAWEGKGLLSGYEAESVEDWEESVGLAIKRSLVSFSVLLKKQTEEQMNNEKIRL